MAFVGPAEDRLAIRELLETYADAVCRVDAQAWGETWAENARWALPDYPEIGTIEGRTNIVAAWKVAMTHYPGIIFVTTPGSIEIEGNQARARSYTSEVYDQNGVTKRDRGEYDDLLIKQNGRWLFKQRTFRNVHRA